ncbi:MAG: TolC family outer membrane protein [Gammaproteobacteria bacterium]|nr:TolC family outer membrane protein [Gammaproteobacteria bacterium]
MKTTTASRLFATILVLFSAAPAFSQDLLNAYTQAQAYDAEFRAAHAALKAALENRPQARAALLPQLNLTAHTTENDQETLGGTFPFKGRFRSSGYTLSLKQSIYNPKNYALLKQANATTEQAQAEYAAAEHALLLRVADAYFKALSSLDELHLAMTEKNAIFKQLDQTKKRFEVGLIAVTDVKEAQARYDTSTAQEIAATNTLQLAGESLRVLTGETPNRLSTLTENMPLIAPEPLNISQWVEQATTNNAALRAQRFSTLATQQNIRSNRAEHYPSLDLSANSTYADIGDGGFGARESTDNSVSLSLTIPLYSGGLTSAKTRQASQLYQQARESLIQFERSTAQQTRNAYLGVISGISQVKALKQALISTEAALKATEAGFDAGTRTAVDVLISLRETYRAKKDFAQARYDYLLHTLRLKQASGQLSINDISQINRWLE